jgi:hypothetical protein
MLTAVATQPVVSEGPGVARRLGHESADPWTDSTKPLIIAYVVCRTNPASSVVIALARNATWLDDAQVQSVFHRLRHDPPPGLRQGAAAGWDRDTMIDRVFTRAEQEIDTNPTLRPQRRQGLRSRLSQSRSSTGMLLDDSLSALVGSRRACSRRRR